MSQSSSIEENNEQVIEKNPQEKHLADYQPSDFLVDSLDLEFDLYDQNTVVKATSQVKRVGGDNSPLALFGEQLNLRSLRVNQQTFENYKLVEGGIELVELPEQFILEIETEINPLDNKAFEGLYKSGDAFCTQCEAEGFRRITYYLDRPDVLAKFSTKISADKQLYPSLLSNGNRVEQGDLDNGRHYVKWVDPFPKPAYLFALVAGDFDCLRDTFVTKSGRTVDLELFVDKGNLDKTAHAMLSLKNAMKWDETRFNLEYDLDIYMIVAVDFFNMGAMENKGLNVFNSKFVLANSQSATDQDYLGIEAVIGHEYFHNWTGNRITCRDWFQLSLKEGLTVFRDQEFSSDMGSRPVNRIANVKVMRNHQFAEDAGPMSHPIRPASVMEMNNFYTVTVYDKGSEVIRMLHTLLGEQKFQQGMGLYVERHDGQAVTCDDFVAAMTDASGIDLTLFKRWYSQSGTPQINISDHFDASTNSYQLTFKQKNLPTADQKKKEPLHIPVDIELLDAQGNALDLGNAQLTKVISLTQKEQTFVFKGLSEKPVPCLFRGFSAPVKYTYGYSDEQLLHLMRFASDEFSRWDAGQTLFNKYLVSNVLLKQQGQAFTLPTLFVDAFKSVLLNDQLDPALIADMFEFISESGAMELFDCVDIEALHEARNYIIKTLATSLQSDFVTLYHQHHVAGEYQPNSADIGQRKLANCAIAYIAKSDKTLANELVLKQIEDSNNMTVHLGALQAANSGKLACRDAVMADFDDKWFENGLVMDKWFALQASLSSDSVLANIEALFAHRSFDYSNPNRLRALVGTFVNANSYYFHAIDGSGYRFLTDQLIKLNSQNPQVAARLITPLIQFKRLDKTRIELIKSQLQRLLAIDDLSLDLYEKVSKALAQ
ncbi:aminopeptidase N [Psychromonas sp. psych-6C06]|uniref:aminopeptidase N n=1 Tax=Psychromonas sp. psych-6C06 TaxID=2058089 RepID=UPI000C33BA19|nr:aminopeptidase N [Psychromonas sp. psych-6C06]PKF60386.1 aminopeptidase N [Psychromonas sp. psych-6C06]